MMFDLHTIAQFSALRIVDSLAEGTVIGVFAVGLLWLVRGQNAATKYAIGFAALAAIALLPAISLLSSRTALPASEVRPAITLPDSWAIYVFAAWAVIGTWFLIGVGRSFLRLRILRRSCTPVDLSTLDPVLLETLQCNQTKRKVAVCTSEQVRVPTALGLVKPAIVIPVWAIQELSADELKQILLHELAHLRRWDDWTNLAQQLVKAVFFFHPAVWWIESKAALEREIACDDAVLEATGSPRAYAECLAHLAERSFFQRGLALAQAAIGRLRQTTSRVAQILDSNRPKANARTWKVGVSSVAGFAVACAVGLSRAPKLIAFESSPTVRVAEFPQTHIAAPARRSVETIPASLNGDEISPEVRVTPAKLNIDSTPHRSFRKASAILRPKAGHMVHLASVEAVPAPMIETVLVLIQSPGNDSLGQIQIWQVTLVRFVQEPVRSTTPPRKT
ncbi:MAG TPA: M56 family metallopeptidase [Candidatus Sulfotelmatobacter sp.]|nr:M56 family metallopeptidase [Candidatus Sulfotelmatobacter sp.]